MKQKSALGFDLDGVIIDHTSNKLHKARELGYQLEPHDTASAVMKSRMALPHYREVQKHIYGPQTITAPAIEGALETIEKLAFFCDLYIISRRDITSGMEQSAQAWLKKHGILEHTAEKQIFFVPHDIVGAKDEVARKFGIRVYLDDQLKILHELPSVAVRILFDPFWAETAPHPFLTIKKWQELPAILNLEV